MAKAKSATSETVQLATDKLESSGLSLADAAQLGVEFLDPDKVVGLHSSFKRVPAIKLNYFNPLKPNEPLAAKPSWPPFYRLRYLRDPPDFQSLVAKKPPRYVQEPDSGVCAYFPRLTNTNWREIFPDSGYDLLITEGEFKAAKACREGFPTIGLGGVHNWRSARLGFSFLPDLEAVNWVKRRVYITFDSDFRTNKNVCSAINELAEMLESQGALVNLLPLPDVMTDDKKTGLDDYLITCGPEDLSGLMADISQPLTLARPLWSLNEQVTYVRDPGLIVVNQTHQKLSPNQFKDHAYAAERYSERTVRPDGTVSLTPTPIGGAWLRWPLRNEVHRLTYKPGRPELVEGDLRELNTWPGWGIKPAKGDVKPFLRLIDHLFTGADQASKHWFLQWCAYPIQYPGVKMFSSAVIHGVRHGTGKSLIGYLLGRIYGRNFTEIKQADLHANFNEWAENKQFVLGDDVTGSDKRQDADMLKKLITQRELRLNPKYVPSYVVPDCINYLWTSNQPDAFFLEDDDRRFFVHEVTVEPLAEEFYVDFSMWMETEGGPAVFDWLLKYDTSTFNPSAPALRTAAKIRMTEDARSDLGAWVRMLVANPEGVLKLGEMEVPGDLFSNRQLLRFYDPLEKTRTTANGLGRELRRAGVPQILDGMTLKTPDGHDRFYVIRNKDRWLKATREQVQKYFDDMNAPAPPKKKRF